MRRFSGLIVIVTILAGCGPTAGSPTPTPSPYPEVTTTPTATDEIAPTATATPGGATIVSFVVSPAEAAPGDTVTLRWETEGGYGAEIAKLLPVGTFGGHTTGLPASGETQIRLDAGDRNKVTFVLTVTTAGDPISAQAEVRLSCPVTWFFEGGPADTCPLWAADKNAGEGFTQEFENGQIIYSGGDGWAVVLYEDGPQRTWDRLYPDWKSGDPDSDPALVPPADLFQPVREIGAVWRSETTPGKSPRDRLGWAYFPEVALATNYQCDSDYFYTPDVMAAPCFITGRGGVVYKLWADPATNTPIWDIETEP